MRRFERVLKIAFVLVFIVALFVFSVAVFKQVDPGEAYIGSFDSNLLDEGWTIIYPDGHVEENVSIPLDIDVEAGSVLAIEHTLPDDVGDGMRLGLRSSREEMTVYIADEQRSEYKVEDFIVKRKSVVSAFILVDLKDADAGQTLRIEMSSPSDPVIRINDINYAYGNNVWFSYIGHNINLVFIAILMICIGMFAIVVFLFIRKKVAEAKSVFYHAQTIIIAGLWMLSESELRQVIFHSPSLSNVFSFMLIEIIAAFGSMYCNEVQKHHYARIYTLLQSVILLQVLANIVLNVTGVVDFYDTLILSHAWSALTIIVVAGTLIADGITGRIRRYGFTAIGMVLLVIFSMLEIVNFYFINIVSMGFLLGIGLLMLLAFTTVQVVIDLIRSAEKRRRDLEKANRTTFQTIASTIDAKDRYTGGHSERVGHYAKLLCKAVAEEYGFTHDDISAVNYIGKMHDLGKIGVPDKVLNKNGRLTDEEFDLMKQHTIIGYDMLKNIDYIPGLRDGVRSHHERWDGGGYPDGLKGEKIPLYARILCIADSYDAMTTDRVYRKKLSKETVLEELEKNKGKQFDPHLADVFIGMIRGGVV
ncbi:HD domain-containing protein [Ruminococcaceae bacterium KH2T8]|nr:HD domain-containing protein [Ruminococcaceae bacterium KH2T8]